MRCPGCSKKADEVWWETSKKVKVLTYVCRECKMFRHSSANSEKLFDEHPKFRSIPAEECVVCGLLRRIRPYYCDKHECLEEIPVRKPRRKRTWSDRLGRGFQMLREDD